LRSKIRHTARLFPFIAGLIILAHTVVPHHHHFDFLFSHQDIEQCDRADQNNNSEIPDTHCHAFNLLVVDKDHGHAKIHSLPVDLHADFFLLPASTNTIVEAINIPTTFLHIFTFKEQYYSSCLSLRGPPFLFS